jgi:hydroxyethylthiazole kinase-like sugar kinase family protein
MTTAVKTSDPTLNKLVGSGCICGLRLTHCCAKRKTETWQDKRDQELCYKASVINKQGLEEEEDFIGTLFLVN